MSSTKAKVELSLDEIIKNNKREEKNQKGRKNGRIVRRSGAGVAKKGVMKRRPGVIKRNLGNRNRITNGQINRNAPVKAATQRLVTKLVKRALRQVTGGAPRVGAVRNVVRRQGGIRGRGRGQPRNISLNRVSQRSRVIGRRSRGPVAIARGRNVRVLTQGFGGRRRQSQFARRQQNPIAEQLNFLRRQQRQQQQPRSLPAIIRQRRQFQQPIRQVQQPIRIVQQPRRQIQAPATRVIYVQQQRPPRRPRPQQQQIIYVQQPSRRPFRRRPAPQQRRNNDPFFEPPNFLQRIPETSGGSFRGRRGRRF